ncbi:glycosyl transferase family 1, partial [Streptococcus agalactiae]
ALPSHQHVDLRDIPVYNGGGNEDNVELANDVDGFVEKLDKVLSVKSEKIKEGYHVAVRRSIERIANELASVYQKVMEL